MSSPGRPEIAIAAGQAGDVTMLAEWLQAAGFAPVALADATNPAVVLVRWPAPVELATVRGPLVVLHDAAAQPPVLARGDAQCVAWPDAQDVRSLLAWSSHLFTRLRQLTNRPLPAGLGAPAAPSAPGAPAVPAAVPPRRAASAPTSPTSPASSAPVAGAAGVRRPRPVELVAIGVSTGGPVALRELFAGLHGTTLPPIAVVQHIPPDYVADLANRLTRQTGYRCVQAAHGEPLLPGVAYFAGGDRHLRVFACAGKLHATYSDDAPRRGHRPAVDVLFESCCQVGAHGVGVVLTGMGQDGAQGLVRLRERGWATLGQDEASSAIYGMPRAAKALGGVERELPLAAIAPALVEACRSRSLALRG